MTKDVTAEDPDWSSWRCAKAPGANTLDLLEALRDGRVQRGELGFRPVGRRYVFTVDPSTDTLRVGFDGRETSAMMSLEVLLSEYELVEVRNG